MNRGFIPGLNADGWREYRPKLLTAGSGGETQPTLDEVNGHWQFGRYIILNRQIVVAEVQLSFVGTFNVGAGSAYVISLPFPANRWTGQGSASRIPIGQGMTYFSYVPAPNANTPVVPTLADPFTSLAGSEDYYFQCYCPYILDWGTSAILATNSAVTVSHRAKYAFSAYDVEITPTVLPAGTNQLLPLEVDTITSTTFRVKAQGAVNGTGSDLSFSYKIRGEPPTGQAGALMSPTVPWDWTRGTMFGPFGNIFVQLAYQAQF